MLGDDSQPRNRILLQLLHVDCIIFIESRTFISYFSLYFSVFVLICIGFIAFLNELNVSLKISDVVFYDR